MSKEIKRNPSRLLQALVDYDLSLQEEVEYWKEEAFKWQKKYTEALNDSIKSASESQASLLKAILAGAFATPEEHAARVALGLEEE